MRRIAKVVGVAALAAYAVAGCFAWLTLYGIATCGCGDFKGHLFGG